MKNSISIIFSPGIKPVITKKSLIKAANIIIDMLGINKVFDIGIVLTDDKRIRELNKQYRGIDSATDVLSFYMIASKEKENIEDFIVPPDNIEHLGEVIISYEMASRQAKENGLNIKDEITMLLIHGMLHLLNYDHENESDRKVMQKKETEIMKRIKADREFFT